jgi:two-component system, NarL family, response regulator DevR
VCRKVADVMAVDVVKVHRSTSVEETAQLLRLRPTGVVAVVDEQGAVVGIVAGVDLLHNGLHPRTVIEQIMRMPAVAVPSTATLADAARLMLEERIDSLPVVDEAGQLTGMLRWWDVVDDLRDRGGSWQANLRIELVNGTVTVRGRLPSRSDAAVLISAIEAIEAIEGVSNRLMYGPGASGERPRTQHPALLRVMVADGHGVIRDGIRALLQRTDDLVMAGEAETAAAAVAEAARVLPDVLVMDLDLPGGSAESIREIGTRRSRTRVLVLAAFVESETLLASIAAGAAGFILKQARGRELIQAIRAVGQGNDVLDPVVTGSLMARLREGSPPPGDKRLARLSPQEQRVLSLVSTGMTNRQIGEELRLTEKTVKNYVSRVLTKLEVNRRGEAAAYLTGHVGAPGQQAGFNHGSQPRPSPLQVAQTNEARDLQGQLRGGSRFERQAVPARPATGRAANPAANGRKWTPVPTPRRPVPYADGTCPPSPPRTSDQTSS